MDPASNKNNTRYKEKTDWWFMFIFSAFWALCRRIIMIGGQPELHPKFEARVCYRVRPCFEEQTIQTYMHVYIHTYIHVCTHVCKGQRFTEE